MTTNNILEVRLVDDISDDDIGENEFGFIITEDGTLKSVIFPEQLLNNPPEQVQLILKIFGINTFDTNINRTLH